MMAKQPRHTFSMPNGIYYTLKELSTGKGYAHVAPLALEIFEDYIQEHNQDLLKRGLDVIETASNRPRTDTDTPPPQVKRVVEQ
jgi:hypothetical protein